MLKTILKGTSLYILVGGIIFLITFFIGIFGINLSIGESLMLAGFLGACAIGATWWREHGW